MNPTYMLNTLPIRDVPDRVCAWCGKSEGRVERDKEQPKIEAQGVLWRFVCKCGSVTFSRTNSNTQWKPTLPSSARGTRTTRPE